MPTGVECGAIKNASEAVDEIRRREMKQRIRKGFPGDEIGRKSS